MTDTQIPDLTRALWLVETITEIKAPEMKQTRKQGGKRIVANTLIFPVSLRPTGDA